MQSRLSQVGNNSIYCHDQIMLNKTSELVVPNRIKTNYLTRNKQIGKLRKEKTVKALRGLRQEHLVMS